MSTKEIILHKIADYLARRDHSVQEIKQKLAQKKSFDLTLIEEAIALAQEKKWFLPQNELSEKVARSLGIKHKSHFFILGYLKEKGLPPVPFSEEQEIFAIKNCLRKKFKATKDLSFEDKQKALRFLATRGFHRDTCYKVLETVSAESTWD